MSSQSPLIPSFRVNNASGKSSTWPNSYWRQGEAMFSPGLIWGVNPNSIYLWFASVYLHLSLKISSLKINFYSFKFK